MAIADTTSELEVVKLILAIITPGGVAGLGWWLHGVIRNTEEKARIAAENVAVVARQGIESVAAKAEAQLDKHEAEDQRRHEENLGNFEKGRDVMQEILVRMARAGINGGAHH